ncbi:MAG: aldehyde ferredoxin oxidoreductase family protein, partial [Promethearchaeota archaeon]
FVVCAKSPYTGVWGEAKCGGYLGPEIKKAGYDGIIITGASDTPVYLDITEEKTEIKDASDLWGKGIDEVKKILKERSGSNLTRIASIGQAGEKLVKYAIIGSEDKVAGRTGMGTVMGSKKLKAIAVRGKKKDFKVANLEVYKKTISEIRQNLDDSGATAVYGEVGSAGSVDMFHMFGELPMKYWTQGEWPECYDISGNTASEKIYTKSYPCFSCPIGCAKKGIVKEGEYKTDGEVECPEYETLAGFGALLLNNNLESIVHANVLCNDYGIDTISTSSVIGLIYYLFDKGKINSQDIDGLEPKWGDDKIMIQLVKKIAFREGIGDLLAEGSDAVGKKFNISQDEIATVYGLEVTFHDLRSCYGMAVAFGLGLTRGPCHCASDMYAVALGIPVEDYGIMYMDKYKDDAEMAINAAKTQDYRAISSSLSLCIYANPPVNLILNLINAVTGLGINMEQLKIIGERIYMIKRLFNLKMGIKAADDRLPEILLRPLPEGGAAGKSPNFEQLKEEYYKYRTFDLTTGRPSQQKLKSLSLDTI